MDMLDYTTNQLEKIMDMELSKGAEIEQEGNRFIAYSLSTDSLQEVQDGYMKLKLSHPKARHIICAYLLKGSKFSKTRGYCDDGEHAAGTKILQFMADNNIECRALYVIRYYSGVKLQQDRFLCIYRAVRECLETYSFNTFLGYSQEIPSDEESNDEAEQYQIVTRGKSKARSSKPNFKTQDSK